MTTALIIGGLAVARAMCAPALRVLRLRKSSRMTDQEYFAAARRRAISHRLSAGKRAGDA